MVHPYPPLLTIILSQVFLTFGYSVSVLKIVTWSFILINDVLLWFIVDKLTASRRAAFISVLTYVVIQPFLDGNMMWVDLGFVPFVLGGLYLSIRGSKADSNKTNYLIILSGLLFILAALIKQTALLYLLVIAGYLFIKRQSYLFRQFLIAPLFIGSMFLLKLHSVGNLKHFLNWTVLYPSTYWTDFPGYVDMMINRRELLILGTLFVPLFAFGLVMYKEQKKHLVVWVMLLVSFVVVYPRFSFFHLQAALALGAILWGITFIYRKQYAFVIGMLVILYPLMYKPLISTEWRSPDRFNSNREHNLARQIAEEVPEDKTIFLLNLHSGYYVYSNRLPAKPWVDNFGWYYEIPDVQTSVLRSWNTNPPDYILWEEAEIGEWYELGTYEPKMITEWILDNYSKQEELQNGVWLWKLVGE